MWQSESCHLIRILITKIKRLAKATLSYPEPRRLWPEVTSYRLALPSGVHDAPVWRWQGRQHHAPRDRSVATTTGLANPPSYRGSYVGNEETPGLALALKKQPAQLCVRTERPTLRLRQDCNTTRRLWCSCPCLAGGSEPPRARQPCFRHPDFYKSRRRLHPNSLLHAWAAANARTEAPQSSWARPKPPLCPQVRRAALGAGAAGRGRPRRRGDPTAAGRSVRAPGRRSRGAGGARGRCGERDGRRRGGGGGREEGREGRREALARLPASPSGGSAALPVQQSRRRSKWGGGAERAALRGRGAAGGSGVAGGRASNAPHFPACAALPPPPPPPAPGFEAFVFPVRCDARKLPGGMGSGRACAALGSAGHRPRREVRRGEALRRGRRWFRGAGLQLPLLRSGGLRSGRQQGVGKSCSAHRREPRTVMPVPPGGVTGRGWGVPAPGRRRRPAGILPRPASVG